MSENQKEEAAKPASSGHSRRQFLGRLGGVAAMAATSNLALPGKVSAAKAGKLPANVAITPTELGRRRKESFRMRTSRAKFWLNQPDALHTNNGDESRYPNRIGNYSKGLPHNALGEVDQAAYNTYLKACQSGNPADFDAIPRGTPNGQKIRNPQAGFSLMMSGADSHQIVVPPAPAFASAQMAAEMVELYWISLVRDLPFEEWSSNPTILDACTELSGLSDYRGPKSGGVVIPDTIFRGGYPGEMVGPIISQFLLKPFEFGSQPIEQRIKTYVSDVDYLTNYNDWLNRQNGAPWGPRQFDPTYRYIRNLRDLANWVDRDPPAQAGLHSTLILMGSGCPLDAANPYNFQILNQDGFTTFGPVDLFDLVEKAPAPAHRHGWFQKWLVHRHIRPEEFGGRVHNHAIGAANYPLHAELMNSDALNQSHNAFGTYLLSQAYPDGCPLHTSYISGHSVGAGSVAAMLKAAFDQTFLFPNPVQPSADGLSLDPYVGPPLTVEGELNKLAWNIGLGRMAAGIHWRSDVKWGNWLGQESSIAILRDEKGCYNEPFTGYTMSKFDGTPITIA